jgi:hypothetical protein
MVYYFYDLSSYLYMCRSICSGQVIPYWTLFLEMSNIFTIVFIIKLRKMRRRKKLFEQGWKNIWTGQRNWRKWWNQWDPHPQLTVSSGPFQRTQWKNLVSLQSAENEMYVYTWNFKIYEFYGFINKRLKSCRPMGEGKCHNRGNLLYMCLCGKNL